MFAGGCGSRPVTLVNTVDSLTRNTGFFGDIAVNFVFIFSFCFIFNIYIGMAAPGVWRPWSGAQFAHLMSLLSHVHQQLLPFVGKARFPGTAADFTENESETVSLSGKSQLDSTRPSSVLTSPPGYHQGAFRRVV